MVMNDDNFTHRVHRVQRVIREYIDAVGEGKILARTQDKLVALYKSLLDDFYTKLTPLAKKNKELKDTIQMVKKMKAEKGSSKIDFYNQQLNELISVTGKFDVLPELKDLYKDLLKEVSYIKSWNIYEQWFDWALNFGQGSYLATHIAKLTHSSSKGSSIDVRYFDSCNKFSDGYLTTSAHCTLDTAYSDNKYSSISQLYKVFVDGYFVGDLLREHGSKYLSHLTNDLSMLKLWEERFSQMIIDVNKKSYFLSKQIYFPVNESSYHLLMPLISSSLVHEIHFEHKKRWEEPLNSAFEQIQCNKYSSTTIVRYPNKAILHVTGSNHSNASSLNGARGGRMSLMASLPPQWKAQLPSYVDKDTIFSKTLAFELNAEIRELSNYLLLLKRKELSVSEPKRNAAILGKLRAINSQLFNYLEAINNAEACDGWTINSKLDIEYQILFESWRDDEPAKACKISNDWQLKISQDFGRWLNQQLNKHKQLQLTPIQAALWTECFLVDLMEIVAVKEVAI